MILKEIEGAEYDLAKARESLTHNDPKWATVQAYYSLFHAIRALVFSKGYKENSHYALLIAFKELYVDKGTVDKTFLNHFEDAMDSRESADYGLTFSNEAAQETINNAEEMLKKAKKIIQSTMLQKN